MRVFDYLVLELRLILRNLRATVGGILALTFPFTAYFLNSNESLYSFTYKFIMMLSCSGCIVAYTCLWMSWDGTYFDRIATQYNGFANYIKGKFMLAFGFGLWSAISITTCVGLHSQLLYSFLCLLVYNIGINTFVSVYMSFYNTIKVNLWQRTLQTDGNNGYQILSIGLMFFAPALISTILHFFITEAYIYSIFGAFGLVSLLFLRKQVSVLTTVLEGKKKNLSDGFKK